MGAAIAGIGTAGFHRTSDSSVAALAEQAVSAALGDCGLERSGIDALLVQIGSPRGLDYDEMAALLALDVGYALQTWSHGRFAATVIINAAMALEQGLADCALCVAAFKNSTQSRIGMETHAAFFEGMREGGGPHAETPHAGLAAPAGGAALATQRYLHRYGVEREKLGAVALAQRAGAALNPLAVLREPLSAADYAASREIVEPLRLLDCSVPVDTAVALILVRSERASSLRARPVQIRGFQGLHAGPGEFIFGAPGLGVNQAEEFDWRPLGAAEPVYRRAGVTPAEIGTLHCYDGFSPQVLWTLERFGFCAPGEAADWIAGGRIGLGGALPVNTSGGHLSEGHSNGWGQTLEIVRQLRGEAGERQIEGLGLAMWATTLGDAVIYGA
ncbi:MAG TPA: thiolase family protein [Solirubrobacteraceae bacterium]|nr:thiolase family protein [Solirubrobacteraceae bacterium]